MRRRGTKQYAIGHDHRRATTGFQQANDQGQEQQLGLLGLDDLQQIFGTAFKVQRTSERRIGQYQRVPFLFTACSSAIESR